MTKWKLLIGMQATMASETEEVSGLFGRCLCVSSLVLLHCVHRIEFALFFSFLQNFIMVAIQKIKQSKWSVNNYL